MGFATIADIRAIESEMPWEKRDVPETMHGLLARARDNYGSGNAISYQMFSDPGAKAETLTWAETYARCVQAANLFRSLGIGEDDTVAYVLPNCTETVVTLLGAMMAGKAAPINPLLDPEHIAGILRETNAKVLVTLKAFPKTDVAQKAARAAELAPNVEHVIEVDLLRYLTGAKRLIVPLIRPRLKPNHKAQVHDFTRAVKRQNAAGLDFPDSAGDRVAAYFHTGGTTGLPKIAQHKYSGMIYNGWLGNTMLFKPEDNVICPLPLFHVFAVHVILMAMIWSGSHVVFPTPAGYRGDGVFDNFWKLIERWKISFIITVPTALSALMQRPVDADVSSVQTAFSGSSPLPVELFNRFEKATGVEVVEGYGLTEATCLVAINPTDGTKKIGSVGLPFPYTDVKILRQTENGPVECAPDEVAEICIASPGVFAGSTYTETDKNHDLFHHDVYLRTGDLGRIDTDGYLWITGRAKDLIIRGGHNIDPAEIEEALAAHSDVAFAGAIGQPDAHAGELPCAYVELCAGATVTEAELLDFARARIHERAAMPKYIEILDELPKTAVGKVFKPDLRKRAITRIYNAALTDAGLSARVSEVQDDRTLGLVACLSRNGCEDDVRVREALGVFTRPWKWAEPLPAE